MEFNDHLPGLLTHFAIELWIKIMTLEVEQQLSPIEVLYCSLSYRGMERGMVATDTGAPITAKPAWPNYLGRVFNVVGDIDEGKPIESKFSPHSPSLGSIRCLSIRKTKPVMLKQASSGLILSCPFAKGGKVGAFWWCWCGKQLLSKNLFVTLQKSTRATQCLPVSANVSREGNDLYHEMKDSGGTQNTVMCSVRWMSHRGSRLRVALTGIDDGGYFRDKKGEDVLFFMDNIFRFSQAGRSLHLREESFCRGISNKSEATEMGAPRENYLYKERLKSRHFRLFTFLLMITQIQHLRPFAHIDSTISLDRKLSEQAIYPCSLTHWFHPRKFLSQQWWEKSTNVARG